MSVIITGASGKLGRLVAESLMERVAPSELVLVTRHPEALGELGARVLMSATAPSTTQPRYRKPSPAAATCCSSVPMPSVVDRGPFATLPSNT